jgi:hypothetical protein
MAGFLFFWGPLQNWAQEKKKKKKNKAIDTFSQNLYRNDQFPLPMDRAMK